jgi:3-oxoacyl-(acyl-carrier-protein) synthase/pimeloyl-ACP methyl ester carboxylesterase
MNRVVITGVGIIAPSGVGKMEFWRNNTAGRGCLSEEPLMQQIGLRSRTVSRLSEFTLSGHHDPADLPWLSRLSRFAQFGVTVGAMAAADAGLRRVAGAGASGDSPPGKQSGGVVPPDEQSAGGNGQVIDPDRAGVVFSSAIGGTPEFQDTYEVLSENGAHPIDAFPEDSCFYDSVFLNYAPAWVARTFGLRGPCTSLTTGCTAGIDALGLGFELVRHGELDVVVTAAAEAPLSGLAYATLDVIGSLAVGDWPPERASRPFDARRGGFVLGEGAAAVVLESEAAATARGARIYGEVLGYASQNNARHMTDLSPDGMAMASVLRGIFAVAGVEPYTVDYVNAHGSSTPQNDVFETQALKDILGEHAYQIPVSSTKSMIGHSLSAASLTGVIATIGAFQTGMVPPTMNYEFPDPECDLDYVPNQARHHHVGTALVMASGFGGIHSGALLRRAAAVPGSGLVPRRITASATSGEASAGEASAGEDTTGDATAGSGPVLFLHGFGGTAAHWAPLCRELGEIEAVAVDLPGHGDNAGTPLDVPARQLDADLADLAASIGAGRPGGIVVVGHSLGALVALRLAAFAPHRVRALVLLATGFPFRVHPELAAQLSRGEPDPDFIAGCLQRPGEPGTLGMITDGFRKMRGAVPGTAVWGIGAGGSGVGDLSGVRAPALVIVAGDDVVTSPRKGRALTAALPSAALVVLPGAGHYAHIEEPSRVSEQLRSFFAHATASPAAVPRAAAAAVSA